MNTALFIISITMLFMFVFVANSDTLGNAKPLLSVGFFGVFIITLFEFAVSFRRSRAKPTSSEIQKEYKKALKQLLPKRSRYYDE